MPAASDFYLPGGVWFEGLLDAALVHCVQYKLSYMERRLKHSLISMDDSLASVRRACLLFLIC